MKKFLLALLATTLATPVLAAQQPVAQLSSITASREALRTAINTQLAAVQSNFDEVYAVIDAGPVYVNTTAPADTKVVWIDTDQDNAIKVYISNTWTVVGSGGEGSYTLPTAAADTLGGVKVGDRLSIADGVLSADIQTTDISGKENSLGNPPVTGYVLSSTAAGVRSWIEMTGGGTGIAHAPSDGNYYASLNGAWASLTGRYADALGADDYYVTSEEKTRLGEIGATDSPSFAGVNVGAPLTTNGLVNFYGNTKAHPFQIYSQGADNPTTGWRLPSTVPAATSVVSIDTNGYMAYLPSTEIVASGFNGNLTTTDDTVQEIAQKFDDFTSAGTGDMILASAQTVTGKKTFENSDIALLGSSTGATTFTSANAGVTDYTLTFPAATATLLAGLPSADNQILQATGSGTYEWTSTLDGIGNITGAGSYNNVTITQPATGATLTLVEGSTLATSGAYSITLTSTGATNVILPTSGTLATTAQVGQKEIGWTIHDSDVATAVADGKQAAVVPASMNGMRLIGMTCSVHDLNSAASGDTTVVLRRVRGATPIDMTSTGVTIAYTDYTASDATVDTSGDPRNDELATGDKLYIDVNAITTAAQKGLSCTALFQTP